MEPSKFRRSCFASLCSRSCADRTASLAHRSLRPSCSPISRNDKPPLDEPVGGERAAPSGVDGSDTKLELVCERLSDTYRQRSERRGWISEVASSAWTARTDRKHRRWPDVAGAVPVGRGRLPRPRRRPRAIPWMGRPPPGGSSSPPTARHGTNAPRSNFTASLSTAPTPITSSPVHQTGSRSPWTEAAPGARWTALPSLSSLGTAGRASGERRPTVRSRSRPTAGRPGCHGNGSPVDRTPCSPTERPSTPPA